jgi:hypothetical protein
VLHFGTTAERMKLAHKPGSSHVVGPGGRAEHEQAPSSHLASVNFSFAMHA